MIKPDLGMREVLKVAEAVNSWEIGPGSKYVTEFEEKVAAYLGFKYGVAVNSGYSALLIALRAAKEKYKLTKITLPVFTMIATANAAKHVGLEIEFKDVNERGQLEGTFDAVMPVDIYGDRSLATGKVVIEDAAEYFGPFKHQGEIVCFSFNINKVMTTGTGGICVTNNEELAKEMKLLKFHYYDGKAYNHEKDGYDVAMNGMQAAIGLAQMERIDEILANRKAIGDRYAKELTKAWNCETSWYHPILCDSYEEKEKLKKYLEKQEIATRDFFPPITHNPPYADGKTYPVAEDLYAKGLLLPNYSTMTNEEQSYIINTIQQLDE